MTEPKKTHTQEDVDAAHELGFNEGMAQEAAEATPAPLHENVGLIINELLGVCNGGSHSQLMAASTALLPELAQLLGLE